jgi:hypothetical protein
MSETDRSARRPRGAEMRARAAHTALRSAMRLKGRMWAMRPFGRPVTESSGLHTWTDTRGVRTRTPIAAALDRRHQASAGRGRSLNAAA